MRIEGLTIFRFIAVLTIVVFHFSWSAAFLAGRTIPGPEMVTFFFVLSGFVMVISQYPKKDLSAASYWWARIARIVPVYMLALGLELFSRGFFFQENPDYPALLLHLSFLQAWVSPYPRTLNVPDWALSVEAFFYLTFPFLLMAIRKEKVTPVIFAVFALCFWLVTQGVLAGALASGFYRGSPVAAHDIIYYMPLSHYCSFLLGVAGAYCVREFGGVKLSRAPSVVLILATAILVVFALGWKVPIVAALHFTPAYASSFMAPVFLFFIIAISISHRDVTRLLGLRVFVVLGEASYAIYILHFPLYFLYKQYISSHLGLAPGIDFYGYLLLLVITSICAFYAIERPAQVFLRYRLPGLLRR